MTTIAPIPCPACGAVNLWRDSVTRILTGSYGLVVTTDGTFARDDDGFAQDDHVEEDWDGYICGECYGLADSATMDAIDDAREDA